MKNQTCTRQRVVIAGLTFCLLLLHSQAATFTVETMSALRSAIQQANATATPDTIRIRPGTYTITHAPQNDNNITTGDLDITRQLTIERLGTGVVIIDGGQPPPGAPPERTALDRLFEIHPTAGNVVIRGLTLRGGWDAKEGGALYNASQGTVRLIDVLVVNNSAMANGGAIYHDGFAGGRLVVEDSTLDGNVSAGEGGAIYVGSGRLTVTDAIITGNAARNGGGIYSAGRLSQAGQPARVEVEDTLFAENNAGGDGGAIANELFGELALSDVTVTANLAAGDGGGVSTVGKTSLAITDGTFSGNTCGGEGAGVFTETEGAVTIADSAFSQNGTGAGGGGLSVDGKGPVTIADSTFSDNVSTGEGGGIAIHSDGPVTIVDSAVFRNSSDLRGGGILNSGAAVTFQRLTISGNRAAGDGGGIDNQSSGQFTILDSSITSNIAENGGGFANVADATMLISGSLFWNNQAAGVGGGFLHRSDGATELENCTISGNKAGQIGGGLMLDADADLHVVNVTITRNSAPLGAGIGTPNGPVNTPVVPNPSAIFRNTIVAGNFGASDCYGALSSEGGNIDGGSSCHFAAPSDRRNINPAMGDLANNGGPTLTHALTAGSRAVNAGVLPCPPADQRGVARPQGSGCDCGAYEFAATTGTPPSTPPPVTPPTPLPGSTVNADADAWIDQNSPSDNKGADSTLKMQSKNPNQNLRALVRFPLPALPPGSVVQSATLRIFAASAATGRTLQAIRLGGAWAESGVNWINQPAAAGAAATTSSKVGSVQWNVTAQVQVMYSTGVNNGFLIRDAAENDTSFEQQFYSREKGENFPTLVITFGPAGQ